MKYSVIILIILASSFFYRYFSVNNTCASADEKKYIYIGVEKYIKDYNNTKGLLTLDGSGNYVNVELITHGSPEDFLEKYRDCCKVLNHLDGSKPSFLKKYYSGFCSYVSVKSYNKYYLNEKLTVTKSIVDFISAINSADILSSRQSGV